MYQGKPLKTYTPIQGVHDVLHGLWGEHVFCFGYWCWNYMKKLTVRRIWGKWITYCDFRASASPCTNSCVPWFVTRLVDQAWLRKDDPEVSDGINFKCAVKFTCCDGALGWGDTKKDEAVDRVGGRMWVTKSDLLSRKIVCGVIKGRMLGGIWMSSWCGDEEDDGDTRTSGKGSTQSATSAFLTLLIMDS